MLCACCGLECTIIELYIGSDMDVVCVYLLRVYIALNCILYVFLYIIWIDVTYYLLAGGERPSSSEWTRVSSECCRRGWCSTGSTTSWPPLPAMPVGRCGSRGLAGVEVLGASRSVELGR